MLTSLAWMRSRFATQSTATGKTGPSCRKSNTGGDSAALRYRLPRKQGLQGLRFAPHSMPRWVECRDSAGLRGMEKNGKGANLSAYWVRRFAPQPNEIGHRGHPGFGAPYDKGVS